MSWLKRIFAGGAGDLLEGVGGIIDKFKLPPEEKAKVKLAVEQLAHEKFMALQSEVAAELQAKERIVVAELQQGDNYTKRARPTIIYTGLGIIFANWIAGVITALGWPEVTLPSLPVEFWWTWGGVTGTYAVGRSAEKSGFNNKFTRLATGNGKSLLGD